MLSIKEKSRAIPNPFTSKPSTSLSVITMMMALMTRRNKPKVMIVIGSVNNIKTGLINAFKKAIIQATISAMPKL